MGAGLLLQQDSKTMGHRKSAVLLLGRLLMATLFVSVGYTQVSAPPSAADSEFHTFHRD